MYARQSVEKLHSISIDAQIAACRAVAGEQEVQVYRDAGYSGKNTERPDFQRLLRDIQADRICTLYVYRLDRFSRSVADFGRLWEVLKEHHVEFVSVSEQFDTTSPMGQAMLHIIMVFAQLERETTAQRVRDNYYHRLAMGAWPGGPAPYGFRTGRRHGRDGSVVPTLLSDEKEGIVRRIYELYGARTDASLRSIAKELMEENIPGPGGKCWDNSTVSRILRNPVYVMADEQVRLHYLGEGARVLSTPETFDGQHGLLLVGNRAAGSKGADRKDMTVSVLNSSGLVSADLWLRCQEKLARNRQIGNGGKGKHSWLSGLMKCADCGYSLSVAAQGERRWLLCSGRYNRRCCRAEIGIGLAELEEAVAQELEQILAAYPPEKTEADGYQKELEEIDRKEDRLVDAFAESGEVSREHLYRALARLDRERKAVVEAYRQDEGRSRQKREWTFSELNFEEKKAVAAGFVERVLISGCEAEVYWRI